jgi:hypothetical protein
VALHSAATVLYDALIIIVAARLQAISAHVPKDRMKTAGRTGVLAFFSDAAAAAIRNFDPIVTRLIFAVRYADR